MVGRKGTSKQVLSMVHAHELVMPTSTSPCLPAYAVKHGHMVHAHALVMPSCPCPPARPPARLPAHPPARPPACLPACLPCAAAGWQGAGWGARGPVCITAGMASVGPWALGTGPVKAGEWTAHHAYILEFR